MARRTLDRIIRHVAIDRSTDDGASSLVDAEWLVTNGLGGYASGTVAGVITRRYHGVLVAALPNPLGRTVMLNHLSESIVSADGSSTPVGGQETAGGRLDAAIARRIVDFRLEAGLPVWEIAWSGYRIEKRIVMPAGQNTVHIRYRLLNKGDGAPLVLELLPAIHFRGYEERVDTPAAAPAEATYTIDGDDRAHLICGPAPFPPLRISVEAGSKAATFAPNPHVTSEFIYPVEQSRGYEFQGTLWAPGSFRVELCANQPVTLIASTESTEVLAALSSDEAWAAEHERRRRLVSLPRADTTDDIGRELMLAADQFVITPNGRVADAARARAVGEDVRTVIAGYHWFTDWGRDTMISLEGLTLVTGREREASFILRTFAHYVSDGLIPNMFPDGSSKGRYNTADATLWFFHALDRYVRSAGDTELLVHLLSLMRGIVDAHIAGTKFGIGVDASDGLLCEGAEGYQLTWMDAKVGDWVVTPRRGKAVEINALWYNALRIIARWLGDIRGDAEARPYTERADHVYESFNQKFWNANAGHLFDVIEGDLVDLETCRPNQIFAISLDNPVLDPSRWASVMDVVERRLLTPYGLRSLSPQDADYKKKYYGDLRARDAAYHQGTVWAWLIGPWIDAWLKLHPGDRIGARRFLTALVDHLSVYGVGSIAEVFDAEAPYAPRGCVAQAWSVGELLRCWVLTADNSEKGVPG